MKLTDLRDELNNRAETTDATPDLLAGVHAKITQTKRRRKAGALGAVAGAAVIAAFATGLIPGLTTTTPQPADDNPAPKDYVNNGMTVPGVREQDRLLKGWVGAPGQDKLDFSWTAKVQETRFQGICNSTAASTPYITVSINDYVIGTADCDTSSDATQLPSGSSVSADSALWLAAPDGKPARVVVQLTDQQGRPVKAGDTQVALGIYQVPPATSDDSAPVQAPPTSSDDYLKDGIRYRAKIGGRTLLSAMVSDRGQNQIDFTFTATGNQLALIPFCTATSIQGDFPEYQASISVDGKRDGSVSCSTETTDAGRGSYASAATVPPPAKGQQVKVSVRLEDNKGRPVDRPQDWIGLGVYDMGKQRTVGTTRLEELVEFTGHNYRLATLESVDASVGHLELATPANTPFLISHGSTEDAGPTVVVRLTGFGDENSSGQAGGYVTSGKSARPATIAKVAFADVDSKKLPSKITGKLFAAIYLPAD
ncbi:hypothetical protein OHA70_06855 [Kribbella sp. NBC_00382]|uniref:hypothetical protein n=1 Tax=Kribbella sp. NBC_00382 TaxID=2975967 RepID=UPI002E2013B0